MLVAIVKIVYCLLIYCNIEVSPIVIPSSLGSHPSILHYPLILAGTSLAVFPWPFTLCFALLKPVVCSKIKTQNKIESPQLLSSNNASSKGGELYW